jgi:hypothetical protein
MKAFHGSEQIQQKYLNRVRAHKAAESAEFIAQADKLIQLTTACASHRENPAMI